MPTPSIHRISNDMRMRDFSTHAPPRVSRLVRVRSISVAQLCHQALDRAVVVCVWVGAQEAGEVVDVAAGEAEEGFCFCRTMSVG